MLPSVMSHNTCYWLFHFKIDLVTCYCLWHFKIDLKRKKKIHQGKSSPFYLWLRELLETTEETFQLLKLHVFRQLPSIVSTLILYHPFRFLLLPSPLGRPSPINLHKLNWAYSLFLVIVFILPILLKNVLHGIKLKCFFPQTQCQCVYVEIQELISGNSEIYLKRLTTLNICTLYSRTWA